MRIILLQDVKGVGKKGQTVEVSDGYASNFLLPKRLAVIETSRSIEVLNKQIKIAKTLWPNKKPKPKKSPRNSRRLP